MTDEQRLQILARAEEIHAQATVKLDDATEVDQLVSAAEEAGLSRDAVMQALRERIAVSDKVVELDDLVFAKSADGHSYVGRVKKVGEGTVDVEFLNGAHATLPESDVRQFTALPGQTINCPWPHYGWWDCKVLSYDKAREMIFATDGWGSEQWFFIKDVRLKAPRSPGAKKFQGFMNYLVVALASGAFGALLMRIFLR